MDHSPRDLNVMTMKTLRDEFAMAALTGLLANDTLIKSLLKSRGIDKLGEFFEEHVYSYADGMLKARNGGK
jgi:hypothetical protein